MTQALKTSWQASAQLHGISKVVPRASRSPISNLNVSSKVIGTLKNNSTLSLRAA
jgi:hypothetical protein